VRLARSSGTVRYPARFQLVLAANPCPCARARDRDWLCPPPVRRRYLGRLSAAGPCRARVLVAREAATARWAGHGWRIYCADAASSRRKLTNMALGLPELRSTHVE
jgi:magnesium chelatase family protein